MHFLCAIRARWDFFEEDTPEAPAQDTPKRWNMWPVERLVDQQVEYTNDVNGPERDKHTTA